MSGAPQSPASLEPAPPAAAAPRVPSGNLFIFALLGFCALLLLGLLSWVYLAEKPESLKKVGAAKLPILGEVPPFRLVERGGAPVGPERLAGKIWIADFIFTRCSGPCLTMTSNMKALQDALGAQPALAAKTRLVSITVDPNWDTREILSKYADHYRADPSRWLFLTGEHEAIQSLALQGFKLALIDGHPEAGEPIVHAQSFALVDSRGRIRGYYDGTNASEVAKLLADAGKLAAEGGAP